MEKTVLNCFPMCFLLDFLLQEIRGLAAISYRLNKDRCFCEDLLEEVFLISVSVSSKCFCSVHTRKNGGSWNNSQL